MRSSSPPPISAASSARRSRPRLGRPALDAVAAPGPGFRAAPASGRRRARARSTRRSSASPAPPARARPTRDGGSCASCSRGSATTSRSFLVGLLVGELRQGALEGVMVDAVAARPALPAADVRRAAMLAGDLAARSPAAALAEGAAGLARFALQLFRPVQPMLAQHRGRRRRGARRAGRGRARVEARRRARPGAQGAATRSGSTRARSTTSPPRCPRSSRPCARCRRAS